MSNKNSELAHTNHILRMENDIMAEQAKVLLQSMAQLKERKYIEERVSIEINNAIKVLSCMNTYQQKLS